VYRIKKLRKWPKSARAVEPWMDGWMCRYTVRNSVVLFGSWFRWNSAWLLCKCNPFCSVTYLLHLWRGLACAVSQHLLLGRDLLACAGSSSGCFFFRLVTPLPFCLDISPIISVGGAICSLVCSHIPDDLLPSGFLFCYYHSWRTCL
jgi:hypothetical protein